MRQNAPRHVRRSLESILDVEIQEAIQLRMVNIMQDLHGEFLRSLQTARPEIRPSQQPTQDVLGSPGVEQQAPTADETTQRDAAGQLPAVDLGFDPLDMDILNSFSFGDDLALHNFDMDSFTFGKELEHRDAGQDSGYGTNSRNGSEE
jgi:hypothetical protein